MAKSDRWLEPDGLVLIQGWAREGLSDEQIAHNMGIAYSTFREWKKDDSLRAISAALKSGKEVTDYLVENALYKKAREGDVTACIFWLCNRRPDKWRRNPEFTGDSEVLNKAKEILGGVHSAF